MLKVAVATAVFGLVHSALASQGAKRTAATVFGERNRNGLYRMFFIGQSFVAFGLLAAYIRRQPSRELYRIDGPWRAAVYMVQAGALGYTTAAAYQVGISRISGIESLRCWLAGEPVPPEPEAQGPALDEDGRRRPLGPFALSRHPLNFAPIVIFWTWPRMTTNMLAFNVVATCYLVLGSIHEEARLREEYGDEYVAYQRSGVPFYLPRLEPAAAIDLQPMKQ
jgi:hypothetical protein